MILGCERLWLGRLRGHVAGSFHELDRAGSSLSLAC